MPNAYETSTEMVELVGMTNWYPPWHGHPHHQREENAVGRHDGGGQGNEGKGGGDGNKPGSGHGGKGDGTSGNPSDGQKK